MPAHSNLPRYCGRCGEIFDGSAATCPECGGQWPRELPKDLVACYALLLTEIQQLRTRGEISATVFATLRRIYEERLMAVRPERKAKPVFAPVPPRPVVAAAVTPPPPPPPPPPRLVPVAATVGGPRPGPFAPVTPRPPTPPKPPSHFRRDMYNWAARRQADLVLYLGAFLLTISALIFASYQGGGMNGWARTGLFAGYTSIFLVLGTQLRKWKRVQEAGPIFLALGAVLTPLNFVALYTNVLRGEDVAQEYVWLAGSVLTGSLYSVFALRGYGKLYWLPAGGAFFAAYASLGACLQLPQEWYGPWFLGLAVLANFAAPHLRTRFRGEIEAGAYVLGGASLLYTHTWVTFAGGHHAALPVAHALTFAGIARSAFPSLRPVFVGALPVFAVSTAAATSWAIEPWQARTIDWAPAWLLALAAAYLIAGRIKPSLADVWGSLSGVTAVAAIGLAHLLVSEGEIAWRLPVAYAGAAFVAAAWVSERRYPLAMLALPAAISAAAASSSWAADRLAFEWLGSFVLAAGIGYLIIGRILPAEAPAWRMIAAVCGGVGLGISHVAAAEAGIQRWELAAAYAIVAGGAAFDALRYRVSALVAVGALAIGGAAALWALEMGAGYWAFPALGLAVAIVATEWVWRRDDELPEMAWPAAAVLALSPILVLAPLFDEPWLGAANFVVTAALMFALAFRTRGAFARLAGDESERAARIEREMFARLGSWALFATLGFSEAALEFTAVEAAWTFAAIGAVCWLGSAVLRRYVVSFEEVAGTVGLTGFVVALATVQDLGHASLIAGTMTVTGALAVGGRYAPAWRIAYGVSGALAIIFAHILAADAGVDAWQLPAAYGFLLAALLWDSAWNRFQPAMALVPAAAAAGATASAWWQGWSYEHWAWAPLALALGIAVSERLWNRSGLLRAVAWPYTLAFGLAPVLLVEPYRDAAWEGVAAFTLASAAWTIACLRSNGALGRLAWAEAPASVMVERQILAAGAFGLLLAAIGQLAFATEVERYRAAWALAGASFVSWTAFVALRRRLPELEEVLGPASLSGVVTAVFASYPHHDHTALILGVSSIAAALVVGGQYQHLWRAGYALSGAGALLYAHNHAELVGRDAWELPAAYGLVLAALLWDSAWNRFQWAMTAVPAAAVGTATAFGWWQAWPDEHLVWAPLAVALGIAGTELLWRRGEIVRRAAWPQVLIFALAPFLAAGLYDEARWSGAGAFALAAVAWAAASWRSNGEVAALLATRTDATVRGERHILGFFAYILGLVALGMTHYAAGVAPEDAAWSFAAVGAIAILGSAVREPRISEWRGALTVAGVLAGAIAFLSSVPHTGQTSLVVGVGAAAFLVSGLANRSSARIIVGSILAFAAVAFAWAWADREVWSLALTYAIAAAALFALTAPARKEGVAMRAAVAFLSVAPITVSIGLAVFAVALRDMDADAPASLVRTAEWGSMVVVILIAGLMVFGEGVYRASKLIALAGTAVVLLALELALAMLEVDNIQVHTAPLALYVIGLGLAIRRSQPVFGDNMDAHELLLVLGAGLLVLPPAVQSFSPGGEDWGMLGIACGMGLLAAGLALFQRWLVVSGVVTLVGIAARFIFDRTTSGAIPYWVVLGVAGLALLGVGVLMLLERDWWDRTKARIAHWWLEAEFPGGGMAPHGR